MNNISIRILSPAQNTPWTLSETGHPLLSWTEATLTPEQFFGFATNTSVAWGGARQLLVAVLVNAVNALFRYRNDHAKHGRRLLKETCDWFQSTDQQWLYSFESICSHLNLDADDLRRGLKRLFDFTNAPSAPAFRARGKGDRTPYPRTVKSGDNDGRSGYGASLADRTLRSTGEYVKH